MRDPCSDDLLAVFRTFATFGTGVITAQSPRGAKNVEMDGARFAKLCRETGLLGGKLNATSVDLIFSKVKVKVSSQHGAVNLRVLELTVSS